MQIKNKNQKNGSFQIILLLFLFSLFDEAEIKVLSVVALFSMLLIPLVFFFSFINQDIRLNKGDLSITLSFFAFIIIQVIGIRRNDLYTSLTPIYHSITVLLTVIYARHFRFDNKMCTAFCLWSGIIIILGFATIFTPVRKDTNLLFGNYNTVGSIYFTLTILDFLIYFKTNKRTFAFLGMLAISIIIISNTRTALLLVIITFCMFIILKIFSGKIVKPKILIPLFMLCIIGFIYFYYNIRTFSFYDKLNKLSQNIFHKNFDSGRSELWRITVEIVGEQKLLGLGTGIDLEAFDTWLKTPHSVYFDIYLQNGLVGVGAYVISIFVVLKNKRMWSKNSLSIFILILTFVFPLYNAVGIVFTKARCGTGLLQWGLLALNYNSTDEKKQRYRSFYNDKSYSPELQCKTIY